MRCRILIASGNTRLAQQLVSELEIFGYTVEVERHERVARRLAKETIGVILWDLNPPVEAGFRSLAELRTLPYYPPVLALSSNPDPTHAVMAFKYGCDHLLSLPPADALLEGWVLHLEAMIEAALRRRQIEESAAIRRDFGIRVGDLEIDQRHCVVRTKNRTVELTNRELNLLLQLAETPGVVRKKQELLENVWGSSDEALLTSLTTHINRLRMKIEPDLKNPQYILGVWGVGYKLASPHWEGPSTPSHASWHSKV